MASAETRFIQKLENELRQTAGSSAETAKASSAETPISAVEPQQLPFPWARSAQCCAQRCKESRDNVSSKCYKGTCNSARRQSNLPSAHSSLFRFWGYIGRRTGLAGRCLLDFLPLLLGSWLLGRPFLSSVSCSRVSYAS